MDRLFFTLDEVVNKSTISDFRNFIEKHDYVKKWFICSDYCFDDRTKPNDVMSFVIFPYLINFQEWKRFIWSLQKTDLKNCRTVSKDFCDFSHSGVFFSFSFIIAKDSIVKTWGNRDFLNVVIDKFISMVGDWEKTTPQMVPYYNKIIKKLVELRAKMGSKNFNCKLLSRILLLCLLASYIKYLLLKEIKCVEIFGWLPDRDEMTSFCDEIYGTLFYIMSYCLCANRLPETKYKGVEVVLPKDIAHNMFYDELNRVGDFICGGVSSYDFVNNRVEKQKQYTLVEDVIADNPNIIILNIGAERVSRHLYRKAPE